MPIEDVLQQRKFRSEEQKAALNLMYTGNWLNHQSVSLMRKHDMTPQQYNVLRILRGQSAPVPISLISSRMMDPASNASRIVDKLVQKGFVLRRECPQDRRAVDLSITETGLEKLMAMEPEINSSSEIMKALKPEELQELNRLLDKLRVPQKKKVNP